MKAVQYSSLCSIQCENNNVCNYTDDILESLHSLTRGQGPRGLVLAAQQARQTSANTKVNDAAAAAMIKAALRKRRQNQQGSVVNQALVTAKLIRDSFFVNGKISFCKVSNLRWSKKKYY